MPLRKGLPKSLPATRNPTRLRAPGRTRKTPKKNAVAPHSAKTREFFWQVEKMRREFLHKKTSPPPEAPAPMLASVSEVAFDDAEWQFEIKWDGYRALAHVTKGRVQLRSRNNKSLNGDYPEIIEALSGWPVNAVIDGELVVQSEDGRSDFSALQMWKQKRIGALRYMVFDLLWIEGIDLQKEPLVKRREWLQKLFPAHPAIIYSDSIDECGSSFFAAARDNGLEGIIGKKKSSIYKAGFRTKEWVKIKAEKKHEVIICGYTKRKGSDRNFSSLIAGIPHKEGLVFIGLIGTGFTQKLQAELLQKMKPFATDVCPFDTLPKLQGSIQWLQPALVAEVKYTELTQAGAMRHPSFQGLRSDKTAKDINRDEIPDLPVAKGFGGNSFFDFTEETARVEVDGCSLNFSNLTKIYWPRDKITKGQMIRYYHEMSGFLLPYLKERPQSLHRFPGGAEADSFYQKNMKGKVESWIKTFQRYSADGEAKDFLVCTGEASLLYMANLGCIEMNPWHSTIKNPLHPDWCVIDLDPGEIGFRRVVDTALVVNDILKSLGVPSFPKTSGATGIHIYIPLGGKYNYDQSRQLAELIANMAHRELPGFTSLVRDPSQRKDKIYIDYLQNRAIQTICAPYSLRPRPGATVSTPLHWSEVNHKLKIERFNITTIVDRVKQEGDLFSGVLGKGIDLNFTLQQMALLLR